MALVIPSMVIEPSELSYSNAMDLRDNEKRKGRATGFSSRPNVLEYPTTLWFWMDRWSRDQPQPGSVFERLREAEKRDPGNEVVKRAQ